MSATALRSLVSTAASFWREGLIVLLAAACWLLYHKPPTVVEKEKEKRVEVVREVAVERVAWKTATTKTTVSKPDGTVIVVERADAESVSDKTVAKLAEKTVERVSERAALSHYRAGLAVDSDRRPSATFAARLGDLPIFVDVGATLWYSGERRLVPHIGASFEW